MKKFFDALIGLNHVTGAMILDEQGQSIYDPLDLNRFDSQNMTGEWTAIILSDQFSTELDLIFEKGRLYIRKIDPDYLVVFMEPTGSAASLTLTCDLYEPEFKKIKPKKRKFFNLFS